MGPGQRHPTMRVARSAGGLVLPTGLVGHSMLVWVLGIVCIMYNKMGWRAEYLLALGRCTYNTEKADVQDVVTKAKQSNRVRRGLLGKISR